MTDLFSDTTKFKKVTQDTTLTQLTTLQNYLRTIYNRDEITQVEYESMRPILQLNQQELTGYRKYIKRLIHFLPFDL